MSASSEFAARLVQESAAGFAAKAATLLVERHPEEFGSEGYDGWRLNLQQRLLELSCALELDRPQLLVGEVRWAKTAFWSRGSSAASLEVSLDALAEVLASELPDEVQELVESYLTEARAVLAEAFDPGEGLSASEPMGRLALEYLVRALEGRRREAADLMRDAVGDGLTLVRAFDEVLSPAQREIGRMWHLGELNVAEEHLATSITQWVLNVLCFQEQPSMPNGRTLMAVGLRSNPHDMPLRFLADLHELDGWRSLFLGSEVPTLDLVQVVVSLDVDVLALSASLATHLPELKRLISNVRRSAEDSPVRFLVGGRAFEGQDDLFEVVGADAYAPDLGTALDVSAQLAGLSSDSSS